MSKVFDFVIFGGAGDLALRKLIPAWYRAHREGAMPEGSRIIPTTRSVEAAQGYMALVQTKVEEFLGAEFELASWNAFAKSIVPAAVDIAELDERWDALADLLNNSEAVSRVFYLSTPPAVYGQCCKNLHAKGLNTATSRVVLEKPIGYDGKSADEINEQVAEYFPENNIYRIDHYMGKETVQNLMALRFSNGLFENLWDAKTIDHVQISVSERVGLEGRVSFYDGAGAMRDMIQNHLLQLLCLVAMDAPNKLNANSIRAEKIKVLEALRPLLGADVGANSVRGQYVAGEMDGKSVPGYQDELGGVSTTETFVAIRAHIDNWRWSKVPFYLRTGKRLNERCAEIIIQYKDVSHSVYDEVSVGKMLPNRLIIRLQPEESIQLTMMTNDLESVGTKLVPVTLNLNFGEEYKSFKSDAYKRLMLDAAAGDASLYIHRDEVDNAWAWVDPIIEEWQKPENAPQAYAAGGWGPEASDKLLSDDGRIWFNAGQNAKKAF